MIGIELAAKILKTPGKISVPVLVGNDVAYIYAQKNDLIEWAIGCGQSETGMTIGPDGDKGSVLLRDEN